jgi:hypothetical protein
MRKKEADFFTVLSSAPQMKRKTESNRAALHAFKQTAKKS